MHPGELATNQYQPSERAIDGTFWIYLGEHTTVQEQISTRQKGVKG
jgi:hypothetical protein